MSDPLIYRADLKGRAGLHVLLVGVSDYPHLSRLTTPGHPGDGAPDFGLRSLTAASSSAERIAAWIVANAGRFSKPLGTCRLLLSPSQAELVANASLAQYALADVENVARAARAWRNDAQHPDSRLLFYFAGHGVQRKHLESVTDQLLLLRGFGDPASTAFFHSFSTNDLMDALAPGSSSQDNIARTQYFVFDACRNALEALDNNYDRVQSSFLLDVGKRSSKDDRRISVIRTTEPGRRAFAHENGLTCFADALLKCLNGGVGEQEATIDFSRPRLWNITLGALEEGIAYYLEDSAQARKDVTTYPQRIASEGNMNRDFVLCRLDGPPAVPVQVLVEPAAARSYASISFRDPGGKVAWQLPTPVEPHPCGRSLTAGLYRFSAAFGPPLGPAGALDEMIPVQKPGMKLKVPAPGS